MVRTKRNARKSCGGQAPKPVWRTFIIECKHPVENGIMNAGDFETYLKEDRRMHNFGKNISLELQHKTQIILKGRFSVHFKPAFWNHLKNLTVNYLKKHSLSDRLEVVGTKDDTYELRYCNQDESDDEDEEIEASGDEIEDED